MSLGGDEIKQFISVKIILDSSTRSAYALALRTLTALEVEEAAT
jgi:hypothetical protein